ncbi:kinase-like domain-containing protein [Podospora didyma]|uniref:Kinase-like domain-containing protein n=1 Tax=Podospora didyma TaxID=330526 RepID=A0AAE0P5F3_9PEZI|nr:kinase-like domain-containing protein [Podospora didyma]
MIAPATPALKTVRGFTGTPVTSGDEEESDYCPTPQLQGQNSAKRGRKPRIIDDVVSANCSPILRPSRSPAVSGIGKLRRQLEPLMTLDSSAPVSSRTSSMTRSDSQPPYPSPLVSDTALNRSRHNSRAVLRSKTSTRRGSASGSGDETGSEATTSYEIDLEDDFEADPETVDGGASILPHAFEDEATPRQKMTAEDFEPLRCLGKGTYGTVLLVKQRTTGRLYAQKQFKKASLVVHKKLVEQTKTERQILESVNRHPFVVKLFYAFQDQEKLYLILEYGQGGELFTHLSTEKMFPESTAAFYMAEMVLALSHLHDTLGVVYRDMKPENCLLDSDGHLLLTDFGLSKVAVDPDACNSMLGTVEYMAPEVIQGQKYGKAVDWWSLGALGYDLMTGSPPFRGGNHAKIQDNIVRQKLILPYFLSADAKDLLTRLLRKEPQKRLGYNMPKDLATLKKHRFFRKIDWKKLAAREVEPPIQPMITDPELAENFASEFTDLSLSPVITRFDDPWSSLSAKDGKDDMFGGFSFVASSSLLESNGFGISAYQ